MNKDIENIIKKNLPEKKVTVCFCGELIDEFDSHSYHKCGAFIPNRRGFDREEEGKLDGFNQALSQINTPLIADEVRKVIKKEIFGENLDEVDMTTYGWILLLLDNLSLNKENKNNGKD